MNRLFWKILLAFWSTLLVAGLAVGYAYDRMQQAERMNRAGIEGGPRSRMLLDSAEATLRHGGLEALRDLVRAEAARHDEPLYVVDDEGADVLGRGTPPAALAAARQSRSGSDRPVREVRDQAGRSWLMFIAADERRRPPPGGDGGRPPPRDGGFGPPQGGSPQGGPPGGGPPPRERSDWLIGQLLAGTLASLACAALLAWYMTRPIRTLRAAFDAAARGRLDTRVQPLMGGRRDEIADLGGDFDRMVQQVQALVAAQRRLLHDVSHELRSPLARIQAATGLARQDPTRHEASLDRIDHEAARLDHLIGQMLALSRLEAGIDGEPPTTFDLVELIDAIVEDARFEEGADQPLPSRRLEWHPPGPLPVTLRAESVHRAIENIVRNALKFTAPDTAVDVLVARQSGERVRIEVADRGPGLAPAEIEHLFQPFQRGAGAKGIDGFGLGLAIAKNAVQHNGGTIQALPRSGGGLVIRIDLPCRLPPAPARTSGQNP